MSREISRSQFESRDVLPQVVYKVSSLARGKGFMMAWQNTGPQHPVGFCFIFYKSEDLVAVYSAASSYDMPLSSITLAVKGNGLELEGFTERFLKTSAEHIGISHDDLINYLGAEPIPWRFTSFINGKPDPRWPNNSIMWRALWGRIVESSDKIVGSLPPGMRSFVAGKLMFFAADGQIILER